MRRFGVVVTTGLMAAAGALGLTGCAAGGGAVDGARESAVEVMAAMGAEGQALVALGFDADDVAPDAEPVAAPAGSPSAEPRKGERGEAARKRHPARVLLRRNTLHGEAVVQTKDGTKTVAVQRGTVTAIDGTTITVRSTDGFTLTWTFGDKLRVVERRAEVQPDRVAVGTVVGVAGTKDGDRGVARLIVIPKKK
ncbi:hypothetical protein SAMN05444365_101886 [Micromonospora pattaloongensis]|uniref:DUF5666 domain-containing protein n=1 Tax=Micromonospora pattaloongensis TaxID=405436 RepID=A0A1H3HN69_9ACTN|nr:hypothetical protein [Micromonospora pattaloongensis]SDY16228.1 hypothetical protein SAMN05444365_101886 [Micromonospora pattaloongensis]